MKLPSSTSTLGYTIQGLSIVFLLTFFVIRILHFLALCWSRCKLYQRRSLPEDNPLPGVSVIKPLVGVDPNLTSNLETFFLQDYPQDKFELLFCVHDDTDPAIDVVQCLMRKHPSIKAKLFVGGETVGVNPKINNMQPAWEASNRKFEMVLISDSGIRMLKDTMMDMVQHMGEETGLVHQMPFTANRPEIGFPATLEKVYFGTSHARIYLCSDMLGVNCSTGMSALMRKDLLEDVGGIKAFGCFLAEDYFFAKSIIERGWKITISGQPALQNSGSCDVDSFISRTSRWAKLRFAMVPLTIIFEPLSECVFGGIGLSFGTEELFDWDPVCVFLIHLLIWCIMDYFLLISIQIGPLPFAKSEYVVAWLYREFTAPFYFLMSLLFPNIKWRKGFYRLRWGGRVEEVQSKVQVSSLSL